jgi:hypothetical protein
MKQAMKAIALISILAYGTHALPDIDGYTQFAKVSFEAGQSGFERVHGVPQYQDAPGEYNSTVGIKDKHLVLTTICDAYPDGCDWHNGDVLGKRIRNESVSTYLKSSRGSFQQGSLPGTRWFVIENVFEWCRPYQSFPLPVKDVATKCNEDEVCYGFIMQTDGQSGALCAFQPVPHIPCPTPENGCQASFKLS